MSTDKNSPDICEHGLNLNIQRCVKCLGEIEFYGQSSQHRYADSTAPTAAALLAWAQDYTDRYGQWVRSKRTEHNNSAKPEQSGSHDSVAWKSETATTESAKLSSCEVPNCPHHQRTEHIKEEK